MSNKYDCLRLKNQLCYPLYLCSKEITRRYRPLLEKLNLTYTQYIVMMYFWEKGSATGKEISEQMLIDPSTLTPLLRSLEKKGFVTRTSGNDRRSKVISLTEKGRELQDEALSVPAAMANCVGLSDDEAVQLYKLIAKTLLNVEEEIKNGNY